ncbi:phosphatase PAP2 family protein [Croceicoccus bisphenolivorans]|uniref:phosphatase PAP2 family protein n=1 Tax=Croceicoccus bisphenolivorans TaxID=1783232 RepID=UPI0009ED9B3C|nr:phosphatase PAP2 family protein [Croceicoccus bisphenolivorans]
MHDPLTDDGHLPPETVVLPERGWRIDPRKALAATAICWTGFAVMAWLVHHDMTAAFDRTGLLFWRNGPDNLPIGSPAVLEALRDMTALGGTLVLTLVVIGSAVALLFLKLRREALLMAFTAAAGSAIEVGIKALVGRARPEIVPHLTEAGGNSFPSGHSFNSAMVYLAIALAFATLSRREPVRLTIIGCALILSALIALSRVWLGVHFPSDVAAGWLGGVGWAFLASVLFFNPAKAAAKSETVEHLDPTTRSPTVH